MTDIEKIREEIESLKQQRFIWSQNGVVSQVVYLSARDVLDSVLSFIDRLEEESKGMTDEELIEEEIADLEGMTQTEPDGTKYHFVSHDALVQFSMNIIRRKDGQDI